MNRTIETATLAAAYVKAKLKVLASGYAPEIAWQANLRFQELTERDLLRECAWVILSSGMREWVLQKVSRYRAGFLQLGFGARNRLAPR